MNLRGLQAWRVVAIFGLFAGGATAAHLGSAGLGNADFNATVAVLPLLLAWVVLLWQTRRGWLRLAGLAFAFGLVFAMWPQLRQNVSLLYYLEHQGSHLALAVLFGRTLKRPGNALITTMDRYIYGDSQSPRKIRYTRQLTLAWTVFFVMNAMVSTALFLWAPAALWSIHANLLTGPLIALMFLVEHFVRRRVLPLYERPNLADMIRAYRKGVDQPSTKPRRPEHGA